MRRSSRTYRFLLLLGCLLRALISGKANRPPIQVSRIIVVPTGKLGDVVCVTPVLRAVRAHLPGARLIVAGTSKLHRPLFADSGLVDEYLDLEEPRAVARTGESHADAALVTGPSFVSAALLYLAGIPLVVVPVVQGGFSPAETWPYRILRHLMCTFPYQIGEYAPRERLRALESLGVFSEDTKKQLGFSEWANKKTEQFFVDENINFKRDFVVAISPSAGNKIKEWPTERFATVADYLVEKYNAKIIITGGKGDNEKAKELIGHSKKKVAIINTVGRFDLDELKAFISKVNLFISVDTGPIYIAEAFDIPTINIVGPVDERVQPPRGFIHRNVLPPGRVRAELSILNARSYNQEEALRQVLSISVLSVQESIDRLISDLRGSRGQS
ncbi:MAG: glycosyltransferase family 9 protein [Patescibacteria group bacterium]